MTSVLFQNMKLKVIIFRNSFFSHLLKSSTHFLEGGPINFQLFSQPIHPYRDQVGREELYKAYLILSIDFRGLGNFQGRLFTSFCYKFLSCSLSFTRKSLYLETIKSTYKQVCALQISLFINAQENFYLRQLFKLIFYDFLV